MSETNANYFIFIVTYFSELGGSLSLLIQRIKGEDNSREE